MSDVFGRIDQLKETTMQLKEFVTETVTQIVEGVREAQEKTGGDSINPPLSTSAETLESKGYRVSVHGRTVQNVEFDVVVMVDEAAQAKVGAGLFVAAIGLGAKGGVETRDASVHRIRFTVPISYPPHPGS